LSLLAKHAGGGNALTVTLADGGEPRYSIDTDLWGYNMWLMKGEWCKKQRAAHHAQMARGEHAHEKVR